MKRILIFTMLTSVASWLLSCIGGNKPTQQETETNLYNIHYTTIDGADATLEAFKGKKILLVNVASQCGNTPQYEGLEALYKKYGNKLVIVGFPCNQFFGQEPGSEKEIKSFCEKNYGVTFPLAAKIDVKGKNQHPIYQWLTSKKLNGVEDTEVTWNFQKYLIDETGHYVAKFSPKTQPNDAALIAAIEK